MKSEIKESFHSIFIHLNKNENIGKLESSLNIREGSTDNNCVVHIMQGNNGLWYKVILHDNFQDTLHKQFHLQHSSISFTFVNSLTGNIVCKNIRG